jgi:phage shock protein A
MGIFSRVSDILTANLNALLDRAEDPEAMLAHVIRTMEDSLARARRSAAAAIAADRRLRREQDDLRNQTDHWKSRAREALAAGREDLARRALARKQEYDALAHSLGERHAEVVQTCQAARATLRALAARLAEARHKQQTLLARHRAAQIRVEVYRQLGTGRTDFGVSLARLEDRLSRRADELDAEADLLDATELEADFTDLERQRIVDQELEALKRERVEG